MTYIEQNVQTAPAAPASPPAWRPPRHSVLTMATAAVLIIIATLAILAAWHLPPFATAVQTTEDAYVRGRTTIISPQVSGYISQIAVQDYVDVKQGQELLRIDDSVYRQKVASAQAGVDVARANLANNSQLVAQRKADIATADARIASAKAQLVKVAADFSRARALVSTSSISVSALDAARAADDSAQASVAEANAGRESAVQALRSAEVNANVLQANVESASAQLALARIDLGHTIVSAPEAGDLSDVGARIGQYVTNGTQLRFLVPDSRWVVANFKEAQITYIRPGQKAWFKVDALGGVQIEGAVERLAPAAGSEFSILRTDNAIGNFTKIPQRISVRIAINAGQPIVANLRPGMSVEAFVDTDSRNSVE